MSRLSNAAGSRTALRRLRATTTPARPRRRPRSGRASWPRSPFLPKQSFCRSRAAAGRWRRPAAPLSRCPSWSMCGRDGTKTSTASCSSSRAQSPAIAWSTSRRRSPPAAPAGRGICVAARNAGQETPEREGAIGWITGRIHTSGRIPAAGLKQETERNVVGNSIEDISENEMEIWYSPHDRFSPHQTDGPTGVSTARRQRTRDNRERIASTNQLSMQPRIGVLAQRRERAGAR